MVEQAIAQLERANLRLLDCPASDIAELERALAERDEAVGIVAGADPTCLDGPLAERLLRAFEDGHRVRGKLASVYRNSDAELKRIGQIQSGDPQPIRRPEISIVG